MREVANRLAGLGLELLGVRANPEHGTVSGVRFVHGIVELDHLLAQAEGTICREILGEEAVPKLGIHVPLRVWYFDLPLQQPAARPQFAQFLRAVG